MSGSDVLAPAAVEALCAHPGFDAAVRRAAGGMVALRQRNRFTGWLVSDRARAILHHALICLDADGDPDDPRAGLTPGRFKALCVERGLCSPGRAGAILAVMRASGMLQAAGSSADGRVVRLRPTERLREAARSRLRVQMDAFAPIRPSLAEAADRLGCATFERVTYREFGVTLAGGLRLLDLVPELEPFARRDAGMLILFAMLVDAQSDGGGGASVELSIAGLARRLQTSRPHVLRVVRQAEAAGLLTRADGGNMVDLTPLLVRSIERFYAGIVLLILHCTDHGLKAAPSCSCCPQRLRLSPAAPAWMPSAAA